MYFRNLAESENRQVLRIALEIACYLCIGMLYSEFLYYCNHGRLSPAGLGAFLTGVLLWKKLFCGILTLGEKDEKEKQTSRVRKK